VVEFIALDVETANEFMGSICQIGLVSFENGQEASSISQLINPNDYFSALNIAIHGITEEHVQAAPDFRACWPDLYALTLGKVVVHHTPFDRISLKQACEQSGLPEFDCLWLDSAKVARRILPEGARRGYGLAPLAGLLEIDFQHHDAREDARAAGLILLRLIEQSGIPLEDWLDRQRQPITLGGRDSIRRQGGEEGPLAGECVVFTGALVISRREAANRAQALGAAVDDLLNKKTTLLVVGDQDLRKLAGHAKSSKHRKAEEMIASGHPLRIIAERDFFAL